MRLLLFCLFLIKTCFSYKFLVYSPLFAHSHSNFLGKIADTLTEAGHDVTVLLPLVDETLVNKTGVSLTKKVILLEQDPRVKELIQSARSTLFQNLWTMTPSPITMFKILSKSGKMAQFACEDLFNNTELLEKLAAEKFDVGIVQPHTACGQGLFRHLGIEKTIGALSVVHREIVSYYMGEPVPSSYVPTLTVPCTDEMTLYQRFKNIAGVILSRLTTVWLLSGEEAILKEKMGENYWSFEQFVASHSLMFTNSNPYLNFPRPKLHKTVEIGGIVVDTEKEWPLEEKWDKILSERPLNVLISFGSIAKSKEMPEPWKKSLLSVFESLPNVTFIWKYEEETDIANNLPNTHLSPWLPQKALLADPRLSLFVTHGGLGSTTEVAHFGKPVVMIPLFSEQPRNAHMLARHGGAVIIEKHQLADKELLLKTINNVLNDEKYQKAATKLAEKLRDQPISAKDIVVSHAEFVAKHGPLTSLDPYGRHLNLFQYYLIDVLVILIISLVSLIFLLVLITRTAYRCLCGSRKEKHE